MNYFLERTLSELGGHIKDALKIDDDVSGNIEVANPKSGADFALPCFVLASRLGKNPVGIAKELAEKLKSPLVGKVEASGPYLNIWLADRAVAAGLQDDLRNLQKEKLKYGERHKAHPQTVVVEFPSANVAKPFSAGHLRPAVQGWAMYKLTKAMGDKVITDDHLGDSGTPFGKWVVGFLRHSSDKKLEEGGIYELARVYIQITKDLKREKEEGGHELADEVQSWLLKLDQGDPEAVRYKDRFTAISLDHLSHVYKRLGIHTDYALGESVFVASGKKLIEEFVESGIAEKQADGAVIIRLDGFDTPMLALKSNGGANYATTDIGLLDYRMKNWHPDKIIHVVGAEQQFYFNQLFALAKKLGYTKTEFVHYWFGIIDQLNEDGTRSKMSSRKGVILLEELLDKAEEEARSRASEGVKDDPESIRRIALGAIKFTDLAQDKKTNILFDWQTMFNLQGYSCAYIQYAAVRVDAIIKKYGAVEAMPSGDYGFEAEHELLVHTAKYPQVVQEAANNYEPHKVSAYLYELARVLNRYYETTKVGDAEEGVREARLWLLGVVKTTLGNGLDLLGIQIPQKM